MHSYWKLLDFLLQVALLNFANNRVGEGGAKRTSRYFCIKKAFDAILFCETARVKTIKCYLKFWRHYCDF